MKFFNNAISVSQIKHKDFTGISMLVGECSKGFRFEDWFQSSFEGCQLLSAEPITVTLTILSKSGGSISKGVLLFCKSEMHLRVTKLQAMLEPTFKQ